MYKGFNQKVNKGKSTMVCQVVWDNLRERVGFSDKFCEGFKAGLGAEDDRNREGA